ncbi:iron-sulfur cluster assembly scaffold protein [Patescibacteria group bacterium]|nr:iron-sulfur cluster assembly scaffold protein [Patescibacteria group bacterium]
MEIKPKINTDADVINQYTGEKWYYSDIVKDHFFHPRNLQLDDLVPEKFDAFGMVGSPACGDMMSMGLRIDPQTETIKELRWKTFGCGSAIAATSMFSVMVTENGGMRIDDALKIRPQHIMERLGGLPNRKIHCSVLADKAFRKAVNDYFRRTNQPSRIIIEGARVIDPKLNITDKDIEEAVLEGAMDLESVQKKLKVGIGSPEIITEVEQLIRFYKEKYYG